MNTTVDALDDHKALAVLAMVARGRRLAEADSAFPAATIQDALLQAHDPVAPGPVPSKGDLARQALRVLAQNPDTGQAIEALAQGPAPQQFAVLETFTAAAVVSLCLAVLTTRVRYEKDKDGKVSLLIDKKALGDAALKKLIELLLRFTKG